MFRNKDAVAGKQVLGQPATSSEPSVGRDAAPIARRVDAPVVIEAQAAAASPVKRRRPVRRILAALAALSLAGVGTWYGYHWWTVGRYVVSTDDAYVGANSTTMAAKISGYISAVAVDNNAQVRAGDVIAIIDDGDYRLAVDAARDKVATQQSTIERIGRQVAAQEATVEQARAQLASAQAGATRANLEFDRQQALAHREFASRQKLEQAQADRDQTTASITSATAAVDAALANVEVLKAQQEEAVRSLKELTTALAKAERDLSFAVIRAPYDGVIGNRAMQPGDYVQPGQRLASLVPLDAVFVDANFKETQLARLRPGQRVSIAVDALPDRTIEGSVESVAPASGSVFSLLPTDNATGNFTKIVQRVPVRIRVPSDIAGERLLRPGMSVVVSINTKADTAPGTQPRVATSRTQ
ncbi:MAG TPA: HlyD family secretion protein [Xanthobacteraceae bacterium]|nr:HlyD family secretion protein [Xanthobacteraceae bacterium]